MSPVRNFIEVDLINIETGEILGSFQSKIAWLDMQMKNMVAVLAECKNMVKLENIQ